MNYHFLSELFPPKKQQICPLCKGAPYVFGLVPEDDFHEVLCCTLCGHFFNYPCFQCHSSKVLFKKKTKNGFLYECSECKSIYERAPGWLERPKDFQLKMNLYSEKKKSKQEKIINSLS